ncbi:helix-turn-helix domain-containing protein [Streptomyces sp. TLI_171]|uniref:winged helix-turn-helix transcriptional regulator n=1 Tax=Streptomyces sp. TLI_171 TaxID=1938859 RepID=UPI000C17BFBB|nr:helix-turn-helix domain-containing protein [Streptomyces sp. TLI_171]RKE05115.1 HxlR family transcriptional regulator [Streptomyces sp. TLI_171]
MATRTAEQRRAEAKIEYDAFLSVCPSRQLLERLSNKWVTLILAALGDACGAPEPEARAMRFSELARQLAGVSQKMLTQTLRSLERDGLVTRTVTATVPVTVTYELTELGLSLQQTMRALKSWAETHMDDVFANRQEYDETSTGQS